MCFHADFLSLFIWHQKNCFGGELTPLIFILESPRGMQVMHHSVHITTLLNCVYDITIMIKYLLNPRARLWLQTLLGNPLCCMAVTRRNPFWISIIIFYLFTNSNLVNPKSHLHKTNVIPSTRQTSSVPMFPL